MTKYTSPLHITCILIIVISLIPIVSANNVQIVQGSETDRTAVYLPGTFQNPVPYSNTTAVQNKAATSRSPIVARAALAAAAALPRSGIEWQRTYGASYLEEFASIHQTPDGGYIACGMTDAYYPNGDVSAPIGNGDAWVVKLNASGTITWQRAFGGEGRDECRSIRRTTDGGYVFTGFSNSVDGFFTGKNHGGYDIYVVKTRSDGSLEWEQQLGGMNDDQAISIRQTSDGGYILTGFEDFSGSGKICQYTDQANAWVMKLNANGTPKWQKRITGNKGVHGTSIVETKNHTYLMYGFTNSESGEGIQGNKGDNDLFLAMLDPQGTIQWSRLYGGSGFEITNYVSDDSIQETNDGDFVLEGQTTSYNNGDIGTTHGWGDIWLMKIKPDGSIRWQETYGGSDYDMASGGIRQTPDGGFLFAGMTRSSNSGDVEQGHGDWDYWVGKVDAYGNLLWQEPLGGNAMDESLSISPTMDGGSIVAGRTDSSNTGDVGLSRGWSDAWVVKLPPHLVVDVEDSESHSWVPGVNVTLTDNSNHEDHSLSAVINGRVVFSGSGISGKLKFEPGKSYTVQSTADKYHDSTPVTFTYMYDGQLVKLSQTPLIASYTNSFSITCLENYDNIAPVHGNIDECNNIAENLIKRGYKMNFYHTDGDVTEKDFATDSSYTGHQLTESAFHYHSGHGSLWGEASMNVTWFTLLDFKDYERPVIWPPSMFKGAIGSKNVENKWGGGNKWVLLDSCYVLRDDKWGNALTTSHGILGYTSPSWVIKNFGDTFFDKTINKKMTIVDAYKNTTIALYQDDNVTAKAITRTRDQMKYDQFPGVGYLAPDANPNSTSNFRMNWNCRSGDEW